MRQKASRPKAAKAPAYREVTLPAGTTLRLDLASSVASDASKVEDAVRATLRAAVVVDGQTVVPMGAELAGVVTDVEDSGRVKGRARIAYRFDSLDVGEERYDISTRRRRMWPRPPRVRTRRRSVLVPALAR